MWLSIYNDRPPSAFRPDKCSYETEVAAVEVNTDLTREDYEFLYVLDKDMYRYNFIHYDKPKCLIVNPEQLISILRFNFVKEHGLINYDSYQGIPVICAEVKDFSIVGESKDMLVKYLKGR